MFVRSVFDVTGVVKNGLNFVTIHFKSAVKEAAARSQASDYDIPIECPPPVQNGQCHVNQIRKEQLSFSWDWGPSFPTQGIWKPIYIDAYNNTVIRDVSALVRKVDSQWQVDVEVYFEVDNVAEVKGQLHINIAGLNLSLSQDLTVSAANSSFRINLPVPTTTHVPLWWPNGYGEQPLFDLHVFFTSGADTTSKSLRIGFRTVELVQEPVSNKTEHGLSFYFRVNGIPVFLKGSNWIPPDIFQERITSDKLRFLLESAANVSINSLRIWGGGVYESDEFYQLCDELGIMIWQDFMFCMSLYPTYPAFLNSVATEVTQQLRRLKSHSSIIVWSGNNEIELILSGIRDKADANFSRYQDDYVKLFVKTIKLTVEQEDSTREYITSSPSNGKMTEQEGYVAHDTESELYGDVHFFNYTVDQWKDSSFLTPRMVTEYGIQAWCNSESLTSVFDPLDFSMDSAMVNHRQHHGNGNQEMIDESEVHLKLPNSPDAKSNFIDFIYLTQINQAMSIRTQTEHYRRYQSQLLPDGRGLTMGALYWSLNDIWQAPTWSSIGYDGSWKMLHYYVRSFFSKTLIAPYLLGDDTLDVFIALDEVPVAEVRNSVSGALSFKLADDSSDLIRNGLSVSEATEKLKSVNEARSGNLRVEIYDYSSFSVLHSWIVPYNLKTTAESVFTKKVSDLLSDSGCPATENCLLYFTATDQSGRLASTSWYPLAYPKFSKLQPAHVKITSVTKINGYTFNIEVSADAIALFVWLSVDSVKGHFSDNGFLLVTPSIQVQFHAIEDVPADVLSSKLKVRSVVDVKSGIPIIG